MWESDELRIAHAVSLWFQAKADAANRSAAAGRPQEGRRSQVTGALHLAGFEELLVEEIHRAGIYEVAVSRNRGATLAGYYRPSKSWDLLVTHHDNPLLAVEFKSMEGSEGKNLNNRADEMFGVAEDAKQAGEHGILPATLRRAFVFIMESNPASNLPRRGVLAHGTPDASFAGLSYLQRMALMLERMRSTGL